MSAEDILTRWREARVVRAKECAEQLLADYRDRLTPETYARALWFSRMRSTVAHPEAVSAMFRLHAEIVGHRT